jgi:hypothetical protein
VASETHPQHSDNMFDLMEITPVIRPSPENDAVQHKDRHI